MCFEYFAPPTARSSVSTFQLLLVLLLRPAASGQQTESDGDELHFVLTWTNIQTQVGLFCILGTCLPTGLAHSTDHVILYTHTGSLTCWYTELQHTHSSPCFPNGRFLFKVLGVRPSHQRMNAARRHSRGKDFVRGVTFTNKLKRCQTRSTPEWPSAQTD